MHRRIGTGRGRGGLGRPVGIAAGFLGLMVVLALLVAHSTAPSQTVRPVHNDPILVALASNPNITGDCPWLARAMARHEPAAVLARLVVGRMTLNEKVSELVLYIDGAYENINAGVPRLCIPSLAVQDGPQGLAYGDTNVTQLPSPLGIAATFNTATARAYGVVEGSEAAGQGIDAIQGPTLNIDRVPESGRSYEGFGEDPVLVSAMGVADIDGIQSTGTMAMAKHFAVYNQETDRGVLDDQVSERALHELYLPPFKAAVTQAHVGSVMCAYPQLNGTYQCQQPQLLGLLANWGFTGFIRSDLGLGARPGGRHRRRHRPHQAGDRRPAWTHWCARASSPVGAGRRPRSTRLLTVMFAHHLVGRSEPVPRHPVDSPAHTHLALSRRRAVGCPSQEPRVGPPPVPRPRPVGGASSVPTPPRHPVTTGGRLARGSRPRSPRTRLSAIRHRAGTTTNVTYTNGASTTRTFRPCPPRSSARPRGAGTGLTLTLVRPVPRPRRPDGERRRSGHRPVVQLVQPTVDIAIRPHPSTALFLPGLTPGAPTDQCPPPTVGGPATEPPGGSLPNRHPHPSRAAAPVGATCTWPGPGRSPRPAPGSTRSRCRGRGRPPPARRQRRPCPIPSATSSGDGPRPSS